MTRAGRLEAFAMAACIVAATAVFSKRVMAAGAAYQVDTAEVSEVGSCKVESWVSSADNRDFIASTSPACVVNLLRPVEVSAQFQRTRSDGEWGTAVSPKLKTNLVPSAIEKGADGRDLQLAADEARQLDRQVVRSGVERPEGREVGAKTGDLELEEALGVRQVLQPVRTQRPQRQVRGKRGFGEAAGGIRQEDLAAVRGRRDPRGAMDVQADVVVSAERAFARVKSHPNVDGRPVRPLVSRDPTLSGGRRGDGVGRVREDGEEAVAFGAELDPVCVANRRPKDPAVVVQQVAIAITQLLNEARRSLDVREQERQDPCGQIE